MWETKAEENLLNFLPAYSPLTRPWNRQSGLPRGAQLPPPRYRGAAGSRGTARGGRLQGHQQNGGRPAILSPSPRDLPATSGPARTRHRGKTGPRQETETEPYPTPNHRQTSAAIALSPRHPALPRRSRPVFPGRLPRLTPLGAQNLARERFRQKLASSTSAWPLYLTSPTGSNLTLILC